MENDISIKEYLDRRLEDLEKRLCDRFEMQNTALDKAEQRMNERLEGMNEFRDAMKDQASTYVTEDIYSARHEALRESINDLKLSRAELKGKANQNAVVIAYIITAISIILSLINMFIL